MSRHTSLLGLLAAVAALAGCHPQQPFYFRGGDGDLSHYKAVATDIEYPDVEVDRLHDVDGATAPMTLNNTEPKETWDLTLEEAVQLALANSKVMRQIGASVLIQPGGQGGATPDFLLRTPQVAATVYDPAIAEADPRSGVEGALAAFDTQFATSVFWEKRDTPVNTERPAGFDRDIFARVQEIDSGTFQAQLQKTAATGGTFAVRHNVRYEANNSPLRQWYSDWNVNMEVEARQPLLQGAGVGFNRIAGPGASAGFNNGVLIARINTDLALANFEAGVRNLVSDVENAYWELYFTYRNLDTVMAGRDSALQTWRKIYALSVVGARGGEAEKEAQAREQYFVFRATVERSLNALYRAESNLRYMMGIAATDGRLIRPKDEPTTAKVNFDWYTAHNESMVRSVELREQRWIIKRRELEVIAAKNYLLPRLDAVARYRWLGLGDDLISTTTSGGEPYAYNNMLDGNFQEWAMGLELRVPLGFRREMAGVRYAQLQLARERALLQEQELELSHQLAAAVRDLDANFILSHTNFNRRVAAQRQVDAVQAAYETETVTLDVLLNAQRLLAQAESDYYRSIVDYNRSIVNVHLRKGSLLEYNGVYLAEGPWPGKAYFDAARLARARDAGYYLDYGFTQPRVFSRGAINQAAGGMEGPLEPDMEAPLPGEAVPTAAPEEVPVPTPAPPVPDAEAARPTQTALPPAANKTAAAPVRKAVDLADLKLDAPANADGELASLGKAVRPAGFQQPVKAAQGEGWTSANVAAPAATPRPEAAPAASTPGWRKKN